MSMTTPLCRICGYEIDPPERARLKPTCFACGDALAKEERRHWTVAPLNKSNYMLFTDTSLLSQLNPKRTM